MLSTLHGIKVKFPFPIPSPGPALHTSAVSTSASSSSNEYNYRSALVTQAFADYAIPSFIIKAYPIPAFSSEGFAAPLQRLDPVKRQFYMPISPADTGRTPEAFGNPVTPTTARGPGGNTILYRDCVPTWLVTRPMIFTYSRAMTWKETQGPNSLFGRRREADRNAPPYAEFFAPRPIICSPYYEPLGPPPELLELLFHSLDQYTFLSPDYDEADDTEND